MLQTTLCPNSITIAFASSPKCEVASFGNIIHPPYNRYHRQPVRIWQSSTIYSVIALGVLCKGDRDMITLCYVSQFFSSPPSRVWPCPNLLLCLIRRVMHAVCQVKHLRAVLVSLLFVGLGWSFEDDRRSIPRRGCWFSFSTNSRRDRGQLRPAKTTTVR